MKDFRNLQVWEKSHKLALDIYKATLTFPKDEIYGLTTRSAVPVHPSQPILPRDAEEMVMQNSPVL